MKTEYRKGCLQRDCVERKEYAGAHSISTRESKKEALLEYSLGRETLNQAFKRIKRNHGAPGVDGMTVDKAASWMKEHRDEPLQSIRKDATSPAQCDARKFRNQMVE